MRTAASEHLSHAQIMSRLSATFSALIKEQIEAVNRFLDSDAENLESSELGAIVELAVRLVERSAEWLQVTEVASLALEMRETLSRLGQLRPAHRQEMISHCRVALDAEAKLAELLRTEGFGALLEHAGLVSEAVDGLRAGMTRAKAQALSASRGVIDDGTPDVGPHENLLALTFEIKNALIHQNDRIGTMSETVSHTFKSAQTVLSEWEGMVKLVERRRMQGKSTDDAIPEGKTLLIHQELQETTAGLRTLTHELSQLMGLQYALERRARDLDEHLLWEFLDPLDRFVDELYEASARHDDDARRTVLTVQTGGVGFEPEIGSILLPLVCRLIESADPYGENVATPQIRFSAAREGLEARIAVEGAVRFDPGAIRMLENALEDLGGFATVQGGEPNETSLHLQFPMARSLRSFLIVEAGGQRIALPWSAVERIHASADELAWTATPEERRVHSIASLFEESAAGGGDETPEVEAAPGSGRAWRPLAVLRSGGGAVVVGFDRIVWRENARLTSLPPRLCPVEEVLGGIVAPDGGVTLVLNPGAVVRRLLGATVPNPKSAASEEATS